VPVGGGEFNLGGHPGIQYVGAVVTGVDMPRQVLIDRRVLGDPFIYIIRWRDIGEEPVVGGVIHRERMCAGQRAQGFGASTTMRRQELAQPT
jgi:hypothetical protein